MGQVLKKGEGYREGYSFFKREYIIEIDVLL